ncbi:MAG: flavin reductase family protein [Chloroflexota bacterium]|nr:flavin reductase family protein [Chloroflexota bacterium]
MKRVHPDEAIGRKYPEWIVFVVTMDQQGQANVMPAGWCMVTSGQPLMLAVSIHPDRHTHKLLSEAGEFVIAFPAVGQGPAVWYCGSYSGRNVDKIANTELELLPAAEIKTPLLQGAVANFECRLVKQMDTGDHTIFIGEVVASQIEEEIPGRLLNFGDDHYAMAEIASGTLYEAQ